MWNITIGHSKIEVFSSQLERELFEIFILEYCNLQREEWSAVLSLAGDWTIFI